MTDNSKINLKDAVHEISVHLGNIGVPQENIKDILKRVSEDYDKEKSAGVKDLATQLHKDSFEKNVAKTEYLVELNDEIFGG